MSTFELIKLSELVHSDANIRQKYTEDSVRRMAESIAARGLIQYPVGKRKSKRRTEIFAGGRRLSALQLLQAEGRLPASLADGIPIIVRDDDRAAQVDISLTENVEREALTPVEEYRAFDELTRQGYSVTEIANRYGVTELIVNRRLALARVHPEILDAFEAGKLDLSALQAYTIEPDIEAQKRVFLTLSFQQAHYIRAALVQSEIRASSPLARFVGLEAYEKAGGAVKRDLFDDDNTRLCDVDVLHKLVEARLQDAAAAVAEEGWRWVDTMPTYDHAQLHGYGREYPGAVELTPAEAAELAAAEDAMEAASYAFEDADSDEAREAAQADHQAAEARINSLRRTAYTDAQYDMAGAVLYISHQGIVIERGLVRPEDENGADAESAGELASQPDDGAADRLKAVSTSNAVAADLNTAVEAALQHAIAARFDVAFLVSTATLVTQIFGSGFTTALKYAAPTRYTESAALPVSTAEPIEAEFASWRERLANLRGRLITELADWSAGDLEALHAFCAAVLYSRSSVASALADHEALRELLNFKPEESIALGEAFFSRLTKPQLLASIGDMDADHDHSMSAGKADLVQAAVKLAKSTGWQPTALTEEGQYGRLLRDVDEAEDDGRAAAA